MTDETQTAPPADVQPAAPETSPGPVQTALQDSNMGFMDGKGIVADAKATHDKIHANLTSAQAAVISAADKAMQEVESIFDGPIHDEAIEFVHDLLKEAGVYVLSMEDKVKAAEQFAKLKLNDYFIVQGKAFIRTGDKKIQEAAAYVVRLERATITAYREKVDALKSEKDAVVAKLEAEAKLAESAEVMVRGFWGRLKFAFTGK